MAGHILLHILTGFIINLAKVNLVIALIPLVIVWLITVLELGISILQSYVFITLLSIYFEENLNFNKQYHYLAVKHLNIVNNLNNEFFNIIDIKKYYLLKT